MEDVHLLRSREHVEPIPTSKSPSIDVKLTQPHWLDVGRHLQQVYRHCIADKVCFPCYCKVYDHNTMQWVHTYVHTVHKQMVQSVSFILFLQSSLHTHIPLESMFDYTDLEKGDTIV